MRQLNCNSTCVTIINMDKKFTIDQICLLTDLPKRTVRYYIQLGLVDRPHGETKSSFYIDTHLEQLLKVKELTASGISLNKIKEVLSGSLTPHISTEKPIGAIRVQSHIYLGAGVELVIDPETAGLAPEKLRSLIAALLQTSNEVLSKSETTTRE